jgi:hypothetical protein
LHVERSIFPDGDFPALGVDQLSGCVKRLADRQAEVSVEADGNFKVE